MIRTSLDQAPAPALEQLLRHAAWARRLARSLVTDDAGADDLVHDTWVSALRRPPDTTRSARPWLYKVVKRRFFNHARADRRRAGREEAVALGKESVSPEELVGRAEVQRILVGAVLALREPYRQTILLRYFDGLSSAEIAARTNVPAATVRGRLKTALELLRETLAARNQGRFDWVGAIGDLLDARAQAPDPLGSPSAPAGPTPASGSAGRRLSGPAAPVAAGVGLPAKVILVSAVALVAVAIPTIRSIVNDRARDVTRADVSRPDDEQPSSMAAEDPTMGRGVPASAAGAGADLAPMATRPSVRLGSAGPTPMAARSAGPASGAAVAPQGTIMGTARMKERWPAQFGGWPPVVMTDGDGNVANVAIKIVKGLETRAAPTVGPAGGISFHLSPAGIVPRVQLARVGQPISITNGDLGSHDLRVQQSTIVLFEGALPVDATPRVVAAAPTGDVVRISYGAGAREVAFVVTTDNFFATLTDRRGRFSLPGLPPGTYQLEAWHEHFGAARADVSVTSGDTATVAFVFDKPPPDRVGSPAPGSCRIAGFRPNPITEACQTGGIAAAKKTMKMIMRAAKEKGRRATCEGCHADLDGYQLLDGAEAKLADLLQLVGPAASTPGPR